MPNIFNRFYQTAKPDAAAEGGTGIGLALSQELSQLFKGELWVESEWTKGSTFFFEFPITEVLGAIPDEAAQEITADKESLEEEKALMAITTPTPSIIQREKTILVVEDNRHLREYITLILNETYTVVTAGNGKEALEKLNSDSYQGKEKLMPNLIISDVMMPIMDGFQLLETLKGKDSFRHIPVVMLTARAELQDKLKALRIGVDDYLLKPFDEDELLVRIENLLANHEERNAFVQTETTVENEKPNALIVTEEDQKWLEELETLVLKEMNNSIFSNDYLAGQLLISRKSLYRKIKSLTGLPPNKYIRIIRLQQAKNLLEKGKSVKETAYEVGFINAEYFSKLFKKQFGKLPSEYS